MARPQPLIVALAAIISTVVMAPAVGSVAPAGLAPGDTPDTGNLSVTPTTFAEGEAVRVSANFPDGTFDVTLYKETAPGEWTAVGVDASNSYGNAYFDGYKVNGVQNLYARITSGSTVGRTEVNTLTPIAPAAPTEPGAVTPTESDIGSLSVSPTTFMVGDAVKIIANFPDGTFDVTLYKETGPDVWSAVRTVRSSSSGNASFLDYRVDATQTVFARITSGTKVGRTEVKTLTPQVPAPTGRIKGSLTSTPNPFAEGDALTFVANFPDGTFDVTLYKETAPEVWTAVGKVRSSSTGNATFTGYLAGDRQKLFARKSNGDRTEVDTLLAKSACGGVATVPKPGGGSWRCTFSDEFEGTTLDPMKWGVVQTSVSGFRSGGECYVDKPDNVAVSGGQLDLTVRAFENKFACLSPVDGWITRYTSGMVSTAKRLSQTYGRFEIRARFIGPKTTGIQSAIWLWPTEKFYGAWPKSGEIDIAEFYTSHPDRVIPFVHYASSSYDPTVTNTRCFVDRPEEFHLYAVDWTPQAITITIDGKVCVSTGWDLSAPLKNPAPFDRPFHLNLTQALGIGQNAFVPGTTPLPASLQVDHVRVWG